METWDLGWNPLDIINIAGIKYSVQRKWKTIVEIYLASKEGIVSWSNLDEPL